MRLTIIVPVFNEEDCLQNFYKKTNDYIEQVASLETSVLFVNDGSNDSSLALIKDIVKNNNHFHYISFTKNNGLSTAIKAGIDHISTELIGYIDADLQTTPLDFEELLKHIADHDAVVGFRAKRKDTLNKKIQSRIANYFRRILIKDNIIDTGCPLKIIKSEVAKSLPFFKGMHRFIPALILMQNGKVKQIQVQHFERTAGTSKFNLLNRSVGPFVDVFAYNWMKKRFISYQISEES